MAVTLLPTTSPAAAEPGVTRIAVTGSQFPVGSIPAANVTVSLTKIGDTAPTRTISTAISTVAGTTRRVTFTVPLTISVASPASYTVAISGSTSSGVAFASANSASLTVNPAASLTTISPSTGFPGQTLSVAITGAFSNFLQGATVPSFGDGITINSVSITDATHATVNITIAGNAAGGPRTVTMTTGIEVAASANAFTVTTGTPALTLVNPDTGQQGQQGLSVVITGQSTQFVQGTTTATFESGITVNSLTVTSATSVTAVISISAAVPAGASPVTVTTDSEVVSLANGFAVLGSQVNLAVQPPISPTFDPSQVISGAVANGTGVTTLAIAGGASAVGQTYPTGQSQFGLSVPLRPNAENLLTITATDSTGQTATASNLRIVQLTLSDIVQAQVTAQRLSATQVEALVSNGTISLSNPANFNVSMFVVSLSVGGTQGRQSTLSVPVIEPVGQSFAIGPPVTVQCQNTASGDIEQDGNTLLIPCDNKSSGPWNLGSKKIVLRPVEVDVPGTSDSIPGVLLIDGTIKTLKEFFNVNLVLMNTSSAFTLSGISAKVSVPDNGLSTVVPAGGSITLDDLSPNSQGNGQFVIRGDVIGSHTVTVNFGAMVGGPLLDNPIPVSGSVSTDVEVEGPPTLNVTVEQPPSVNAGVPYTLKVNIANTSSDLDALYASLELNLGGESLIDPTTGLPSVGSTIASLGNILAGNSVSLSYTVVPNDTGPITTCVGGASENITLSVVFTNSGLGCAIGTLPSQTVASTGQPTVAILPAANTIEVPISAPVTLLFSDAIQTGTITTGIPGATLVLADTTGATVPGALQFATLPNGSTVATYQPTTPLKASSVYKVSVSSAIYDVNGLQLASGVTQTFTTATPPPADTTPPVVTIQILPPVNPASIPQGQLPKVVVNATDDSGVVSRVDLMLDGQLVDSRVPQSTVTFLLDTSTLDPGSSHVLTAVATDPASNTSQSSLNIAIAADTTPPTVAISGAASVLLGQMLPVSIQAADDVRVARVDLFVDGNGSPVYTGFIAPYQISLDTTFFGSGLHQLRAVATDGAGNTAQATTSVSVKTVTGISLSPGAITLNGTGATQALSVIGVLSDSTTTPITSGIAFSSSNSSIATVSSAGIVTDVAPGNATITATYGALPSVQATVSNTAPTPTALTLVSGNNQSGFVGQSLAAPLVVRVSDATNHPVPNVSVTFSVLAGSGTVSQSTVVTDVQGLSSTTLTLGQTPGVNSATATSGTLSGSPVTFIAMGALPTPGLPPTSTSELFNPNQLNWNALGAMSIPRAGTTLTVLGDGTVLVIGGVNTAANMFSSVVSGELFTPATGSWTSTVPLTVPRAFHTATLLPNGDVLITGGLDASGNPVATSEVYRGPPIQKTTPILTWVTPASISHATPLGSEQLNAAANVPGSFTYSPSPGTLLATGSQTLSVLFTPIDTIHYTTATATVTLTVTPR